MFQFLIRCALLIAGVALLLDVVLPFRTEQLQVDQHTSRTQTDYRSSRNGNSRWADTSYEIHLIGGSLSSCSVGSAAYGKLKDGDSVEVQATRIFRHCIRIAQGAEPVETEGHWKLLTLLFAGVLIAVAVGWLKSDDDDDGGIGIRLG